MGVLVILSSNEIHIATFVHQMGDVYVSQYQYLFDLKLKHTVPHPLFHIQGLWLKSTNISAV